MIPANRIKTTSNPITIYASNMSKLSFLGQFNTQIFSNSGTMFSTRSSTSQDMGFPGTTTPSKISSLSATKPSTSHLTVIVPYCHSKDVESTCHTFLRSQETMAIDRVGLLPYIYMSWLTEYIIKASKTKITSNNLPSLSPYDNCSYNAKRSASSIIYLFQT